jgi:hypothetical protein
MSLNASIIEQRIAKLVEDHHALLGPGDADELRSRAFVWLATSIVLDVPLEEAWRLVTDGGGDLGIDAMHVGDVVDGEFVVTLVQGKHRRRRELWSAEQALATIGTLDRRVVETLERLDAISVPRAARAAGR